MHTDELFATWNSHRLTHICVVQIFFVIVQIEILVVEVLIRFFVVVDVSTEEWEEHCQSQDLEDETVAGAHSLPRRDREKLEYLDWLSE